MTSSDRHASHDSPYRTGQHVPLPQSRHAPLTSVATSAIESHTDLNSSYPLDPEAANGFLPASGPALSSPRSPYIPGMRSATQKQSSASDLSKLDSVSTGEIQMQNFSEGLPPPPPVGHSWKRIDRWTEDNYEELFENLCDGCTQNDVNELEHQLDCTLPMEVRESLQIHDGQERGGRPTGLVFSCMLLDCEEIVQEWQNWRTVNEEYLRADTHGFQPPQPPIKAFAGASSSSASASAAALPQPQQTSANPNWRQDLLARQDSQPPNAIQKAYAHPAWIPLARDWGGNNIAVDLAPGPTGKWGQIILMGRDYDCKYVVARSWAAFLASFADDLCTSKTYIVEETAELKLKEFKVADPAYMDILRWRADQKYGRKGPKRRQGTGLSINPNAAGAASVNGNFSPYGSPTSATDERGRSPIRFPGHHHHHGKGPAASSPRAH
ncbi:Cell wall assembly regulator, partial [Elasticomyces elasticus]